MQEKYYLNRFINNQNNKRVSSVHLDKERYAPAFIVNRKKIHIASNVEIVGF